jgi:anti-sigma factor RsiW
MSGQRDDRERFVRDVLARTSGSPCLRCEDQLPDLADGRLQDLDRQLVQAHLEHCSGCRSLAVAMGWCEPVLTQLAVVDPGAAFTAAVLARTTLRQRLAAPAPGTQPEGLPGLMDRLGRWWGERIFQPGFAAQVAYAATVLLVLLTAVPGAPLQKVPGEALKVMRAGPTAVPAVAVAVDWVDGQAGETRTAVNNRVQVIDGGLDARMMRSSEARGQVAHHLGLMWRDLENRRTSEAGLEGLGAIDASRRAWALWWHEEQSATGE